MAVTEKTTRVSPEVCAELRCLEWTETGCRISRALDRKLYQAVNKILETFGGQWSRKEKQHLFPQVEDAMLGIRETAESGEFVDIRKTLQYFPTPPAVVSRLLEVAQDCTTTWSKKQPWKGLQVLEPSAGEGNIAKAARAQGAAVLCYDVHEPFVERLRADGFSAGCQDFLAVSPTPTFDVVVMNPPFTRGQDMQHVQHAYEFLQPGGVLVAVMCLGYTFRSDKLSTRFREEWLPARQCADSLTEDVPEGAFAASGTNIRTRIIRLRRP